MNNFSDKFLSNKELGYLVGFFIGDGYSYHSKKDRHYVVEFFLNEKRDKQITIYLIRLLNLLKLRIFKQKDKRYNSIKLKVNSKKFMLFIINEISKYKEKCLDDKEYALGFVSGFIDAEGYVNNGEIQLTQKDKEVLQHIKKICEMLKIPVRKFWSSDNYKSKNKIWRLRISTVFKNFEHNSCKVNRVYF
jgi:hypothetical protein